MGDRRGLILDFDGVVVDTEQIHFESWNEAFNQLLGIRIAGAHTQIVGLTLDQIYQTWCAAGMISSTELTATMKQQLLARKTEWFFALGAGRLTPMPGLVELVRKARECGWYVTIASRARRIRLLKTLELARTPVAFDLVLGSEDVVDAKSDRKIHARAARVFGINPTRCVVIEDSASGVADACASAIGWVIGLTTSLDHATLRKAGAHEVVDHLDAVRLPR